MRTLLAALALLAAPAVAQEADFRLLLGGDVAFGESYQAQYAREGGTDIIAAKGYDHSIARLRPLLDRADYTIVNLETPITSLRESPLKGKDNYHYADPDKTPGRLAAHGVDAVSLANNHIWDFGSSGLEDSFVALRRSGITWFGAGENEAAAAAPLVRTFRIGAREATVGVIGSLRYRQDYDGWGFYAKGGKSGANLLAPEKVARQVGEMRARHPGVFIIAFPHWGANYVWRSADQQAAARAMIDAGVDMIVGHHAHMMQEIERYKGKWIVYSLGNLMFNSRGRFAQYPEAVPFGLAMELTFRENGRGLERGARLYPIHADNTVTRYQPRPASAAEAGSALDIMLKRSALGSDAALVGRGSDEIGAYLELRMDPVGGEPR